MGSKVIFGIIVVVIIAVTLVIFTLLKGARDSSPAGKPKNAVEETLDVKKNIAVENIVNDPLVYEGLTMEVESEINDWNTKKSFSLFKQTQGGVFNSGRGARLIVINKKDFRLPANTTGKEVGLGEIIPVHIRGKVAILTKSELEKALGVDLDSSEFALDDSQLEKWEIGAVLLADTVEKL